MKKIVTALFLFISMAVVVLPASATPVGEYTVQFTGVGGQNTSNVYVYPYNFLITNNTTGAQETVQMMCIDFNRDTWLQNPNETWQANLVNITTVPVIDTPLTPQDMRALAVLDSEITAAAASPHPDAQAISDLQFAAWRLTATSDQTSPTSQYAAGFDTASTTDLNDAEADANIPGYIDFAAYSYFDPIPGTANNGDGIPQRFIIERGGSSSVLPPVPEPSSLMLLGTGILGLAGAARRRFKA